MRNNLEEWCAFLLSKMIIDKREKESSSSKCIRRQTQSNLHFNHRFYSFNRILSFIYQVFLLINYQMIQTINQSLSIFIQLSVRCINDLTKFDWCGVIWSLTTSSNIRSSSIDLNELETWESYFSFVLFWRKSMWKQTFNFEYEFDSSTEYFS